MPKRALKNWIQSYLEFTKETEAPLKFHFWTAVSTIAGALRRRVWIDQAFFEWTPNFFILFIGPPGIVTKSSTANIGMDLLRKIPDIHFGPNAITWQAMITSLAQSTIAPEHKGKLHPMSCITIVASELGSFLNPKDRELIDVLCDLWDGRKGRWEKATKTMGNDSIENAWMNVIGCSTPSWIAENFGDYMIGGGFWSRCMVIYSEEKSRLVAYPSTRISKDHEQHKADLVADLEAISMMIGEMKLTPEAIELGEAWYEEIYKSAKLRMGEEEYTSYLARKQTHAHKLAMVLAAAKGDNYLITPVELKQAIEMVEAVEGDRKQAAKNLGTTRESLLALQLVYTVRSAGKIERSKLFRAIMHRMSAKDFEEALKSAVMANLITISQEGAQLILREVTDAK